MARRERFPSPLSLRKQRQAQRSFLIDGADAVALEDATTIAEERADLPRTWQAIAATHRARSRLSLFRAVARAGRVRMAPAVHTGEVCSDVQGASRDDGGDVLRFSCLTYRVVVVVAEPSRTLNAIERLCSMRLGLLLPR
jgi:hypothetical protein